MNYKWKIVSLSGWWLIPTGIKRRICGSFKILVFEWRFTRPEYQLLLAKTTRNIMGQFQNSLFLTRLFWKLIFGSHFRPRFAVGSLFIYIEVVGVLSIHIFLKSSRIFAQGH